MKHLSIIPDWLRSYRSGDFRFDLIAGLTVGVMLIPQSMAYAMIAGMPPIYGLYASTLPAILYVWFGTSRQLSVGPGALSALLTGSAISLIALPGSGQYLTLVAFLVLIVGLIQFLLGASRLGFLVNFLSAPVIQGFTSAAAIVIGLSQLKHILGINLVKTQHLHTIFEEVMDQIHLTHGTTLFMGIGGLFVLMIFKRFIPQFPASLAVVTLSILVTWLFRLDLQGLNIVGHIPVGLPDLKFAGITLTDFQTLLPAAFAIALISFMESTAVARTIQARHKTYRLIPNRELIALGLANISSAFLKSIPVTGGMSRSIVNDQAGARTGMSSIISSLLILLTLFFLSSLFYYLPNAILAAVILMAVSRLIKLTDAKKLWALDRKDFWMMMVTFAGTLFLGIGWGITIGFILSLAWIIFETSYPHHAELGRVPSTNSFRNVRRFKDLIIPEGVLIFRFDAPLFFANIDRFREVLHDYRIHRPDRIKTIILDMESINSIDSSALDIFADLVEELKRDDIQLILTEVKGPVRDKFFKSGLTHGIGEFHFFATNEDALDHISGAKGTYIPGIALQTNASRGEGLPP